MKKRNPVVRGRMYKVSGGGQVKGIRLNKSGTVDVLVVPGAKKRNPKKKRKARKNRKRPARARTKPSRKRASRKAPNKKRTRKAAKRKK